MKKKSKFKHRKTKVRINKKKRLNKEKTKNKIDFNQKFT